MRLHFISLATGLALGLAALPAAAQAPAKKPPARAAAAKPAAERPLPAATQVQIDAAERVYYGLYECEFNQSVDIGISPKFPAYVDVRHGKQTYLMTPVLSSTGAIRLEDVKGQTLMVQIANKSMLLDVKAGRRIVDDCISPKQRELIETARQAKVAEAAAAASAASSASAASAASAAGK